MNLKLKTMMAASLVAGLTLAGTTNIVEAATSGSTFSNAIINFEPSTDPTSPIDPTDPTNPVSPIDPTNPGGQPNPGTNGPLSIDFASSLDFGTQKITSSDKVYTAAAQAFNDRDLGPNYVQVTDNRGSETGWALKVQQDGQFITEDGQELTGAEITFNNGVVSTGSVSAKPTHKASFTLIPDGDAERIMEAAEGQGAGTYILAFGNDASAAGSIELSVPGSTTKYAKDYSTKLTWTLEDTPSSIEP
ncbi:WxL domain-containing protein [Paenilisteria rocourtiae]|uniref:Putative surface cell wall-binding protein n=1 Tax=Listeria rocourtiae TaxID=647910 RepID=A0A4V3DPN1_9LIST|nr:WxL domain-containing protein [Listeria rocourtiae]EUJ51003.1 WxL domain surface protein [Listeria rocourtiae FSL F6-920]MBC1604318.1 WxL domain-containing protein [Listeria rocourtiae]TDR52876.1 putative surface cell wall-binding protein [Listeria rocourtiae]